jgi:hypothetical protein
MSITSFRLAREAQELKEKQEAEASSVQEVCPMPTKEEPVKVVEQKTAPTASASTVKAKPKTTTQK